MTTRLFLMAAGAILALSASATPLTPSQALGRANEGTAARVGSRISRSAQPAYTSRLANGTATSYVFNAANGGYLIVSADDVAYPVLGYSDSGMIDPERMSPELLWWLEEYGRQIEWAVSKGATAAKKGPETRADRTAIAPLIKTKWDQDAPYNNACPIDNSSGQSIRCYTGCVATSMAQVMNYFKYPEKGEGKVTYTVPNLGKSYSMDFSTVTFQWDKMLDSYAAGDYTAEQATAVATLMKACGYSVNMNYGTSASGAQGSTIGTSLRNYFKYDKNCHDHMRVIYPASEWTELIYNNLKNVGPIVMNGQSPSQGGHSFVCDGYREDGYFHFNWGWSGMSDGYYALDALNPDAQGIGGVAGGFNFSQNAILGIQPPTGAPELPSPDRILQYGTTVASISGDNLEFRVSSYSPLGWASGVDHTISVYMGAIIEPIEGTAGTTRYVMGRLGGMSVVSLTGAGTYYSQNSSLYPSVALPTLPDGKYKVTLGTQNTTETGAPWYPVLVPWGYSNSCYLTVSGGKRTIENISIDNLTISNLEVVSELYSSKNLMLKTTIENKTDIELSQPVTPVLMDASGKTVFTGEGTTISLGANEKIDKTWVTRFYTSSGGYATVSADTEYTLALINQQTGALYSGSETQVVMKPIASAVSLQLTQSAIVGAQTIDIEEDGRTVRNVSLVKDMSDFTYQFTLNCARGYFDGEIRFGIYSYDSESNTYFPVVDEIYTDWPFLMGPTTKQTDLKVNFPQGNDGKLYYIRGFYTLNNRQNVLRNVPFIKDNGQGGVEMIESESEATPEYYTLQGIRITEPAKGELVIERRGSKVTKRVIR